MKKIILVLTLLIVLTLVSCNDDYPKTNEIVMDKNGKFYQLKSSVSYDSYDLVEVDTTKFKVLEFEKYQSNNEPSIKNIRLVK